MQLFFVKITVAIYPKSIFLGHRDRRKFLSSRFLPVQNYFLFYVC